MRPDRLSETASNLIAEANGYEEMLLSAISPWEFCKLLEKGRLTISGDVEAWLTLALRMPKLRLVPLSPTISYKSTTLPQPFHSDPADQIIVATARDEAAILITADVALSNYPGVRTTW